MKRRLFQTILALAMTLGMIGTNVCASTLAETADTSADGVIVNETIEYLPDGSSIVITVIDETSIMPLATTFTKTGSKVYSARNPDGYNVAIYCTWNFFGKFRSQCNLYCCFSFY